MNIQQKLFFGYNVISNSLVMHKKYGSKEVKGGDFLKSYLEEKQRLESLLHQAMLFSGDSNKSDERISQLSDDLAELERAEEERIAGEIPLSDSMKLSAKYGVNITNKKEWNTYRLNFPRYGELEVCFIFHRTISLEKEEFEVIVWREKYGEDKRYKAFFNTSLLVDKNEKAVWTELTKDEFVSGSIMLGNSTDEIVTILNSGDFAIPNFFTVDIPILRQVLLNGFLAVMKYPNEL
ncbi:hypothetical protein ABEW19_28015 [Paenibacillus illinoisensis]|uniref:hypothetical protein n=1 Tax=Paenibacillus illinoisensis TaxID=59845 RepID=UPI003D2AEA49